MDGNILSGGSKDLNVIREELIRLNGYRDMNDELVSEETKLEKTVKSKEKEIIDEINSTIRKRKEEIESTYNTLADQTRAKLKKIQGKKEKSKSEKVSKRIDIETAGLSEEYRLLGQDIKDLFRHNKIPYICNSKLFYGIFMPRVLGDFFLIVITLLFLLLILPYLIFSLFLPEEKMIFLFLVYGFIVIFFGGMYMLIENNIKAPKIEVFNEVRQIRSQMSFNRRRRKEIRRGILKDKDESIYDLENFNQELSELNEELKSITEQKKNALYVFESTTQYVIKDEISLRYQDELNGLKKEHGRVYVQIRETEENIKNLSVEIANTYEVFLGKEFMSVEKLDKLADIIVENNLNTISEAIGFYKGEN